MSELLAIGVSHKTAPVEVRERLALSATRAPEFMRELRAAADVHETVAISTCNRTELYLVVGDPVEAESSVRRSRRTCARAFLAAISYFQSVTYSRAKPISAT